MKRRTFLNRVAGTSLAAGAGAYGLLRNPSPASAEGWGAWPTDRLDVAVPPELRANKVLELCFHGGISQWETFYSVPEWGEGIRFARLFEDDLGLRPQDVYNEICELDELGNDPRGNPIERFNYFADDSNGLPINLGPWLYPLKQRPDILDRMRVVVQRHNQVAHEGANPLSFTGHFLGNPRMAGLGSAIQRHFSERPNGQRALPYSYVLYPGGAGFSGFNAASASSIGFHPGSARPLNVTVAADSVLTQLLARPALGGGNTEAFDDLISHYADRYRSRFRPRGVGQPTRSVERDNYEFANFARRNAPELMSVLDPSLFTALQGSTCGDSPAFPADTSADPDMPAMMARMARRLLGPTGDARYVCWIDTGLFPRPEVGYDVHQEHVSFTSRSVPHTMQQLADSIRGPGNMEGDDLIDLDETLVILNMEFGRTPVRQTPTSSGTNHHPWGYVNVMIGGPTGRTGVSGSPSRGVYGAIEEVDGSQLGYASTFVTPAENRVMALSALGIYPFSSQSFAVADIRAGDTEEESAEWIRNQAWGIG
ncbi:MAG: DUF1501 domain-containing protein [Myxococcota bacterium]